MVMVKRNKMDTAANLSGSVDTISDGRDPMEANDNDEKECDFGDEGPNRHDNRESGEEGRPPHKRARDAKYAIPTMEEGCLLRETEGKLFEGNVLRLEVEELLEEVRVDYDKRSVKLLEKWLHALKGALEELPLTTVTEESLGLEGVRLANHVPGKPVSLEFRPPETDGFDIVGSILLRALSKPSLNVDLYLRIPSSSIVPRDSLNHRYLDKRALYAGHLAAAAMDKKRRLGTLVGKVEVAYFKGDPRKPVVLLYPDLSATTSSNKTKGREDKGSGGGRFVVRLLPCCGRDVMAHSRLGPGRNNIRTRAAMAELASMEKEGIDGGEGPGGKRDRVVSRLPATPLYNSAVLEDMCMREHLAALHRLCGKSQAFRDAIVLGKVWLGQHGMRTSYDSLGGYEWSMLLLYLAQCRRVNARMPALSVFQAALKFIADGALSREFMEVYVGSSGMDGDGIDGRQATTITIDEREAFRKAFPAVMVDATMGFNILGRVSASALEELEMTAKASVSVLQGRPAAAFRQLFMTRSTLWRKCDAFVQVPLNPVKQAKGRCNEEGGGQGEGRGDEKDELRLLDKPLWSYMAVKVPSLLKEGLGDRCALVRPLCGLAGEKAEDFIGAPGTRGWNPRSPPPLHGCFAGGNRKTGLVMTFGLIINSTFAGRMVDKGPPAEDVPASRKFREFWGEKSEIRRFKDGSIVEAVVWRGKGVQRHRIVEQIVRYVIARHYPRGSKMPHQEVRFLGNELLEMVAVGGMKENAPEDDDLTRAAIKALDKLQERAKAVEGMPLRVEALQAASPLLRYTSLLPPAPHPLSTSQKEACWDPPCPFKPGKIASQVEPLDVIVRLESSSKWPDEPEAIQSTATAFLIRLAQCLEKEYKLKCVVGRRFLDVLMDGYCFRLRIGGREKVNVHEGLALKQSSVLSTSHHSSMHGLHLQKPAFGLTVRAVMRWLEEHMLSDQLRLEAVELLVATLFSNETPSLFPPSTGLAGFLRFLVLLSSHDWDTAPLLVDPQEELSPADRAAAEEAFSRSKERDPGGGDAMYVVAPYSRDFGWSSSWTNPRPERPVLGRLVALAKASVELLVKWLSGEGMLGTNPLGWKNAFRMTAEEERTFDVSLSLNKEFVSDPTAAWPDASADDDPKDISQWLSGCETFKRRTVRGCPALRTKAYKISHGGAGVAMAEGHGSLLMGFDPIGDLVSELRRRFGHLAVFFSPGSAGTTGKIAVIWRPSAFVPRSYNVGQARHSMVFSGEKAVSEAGEGTDVPGVIVTVMNTMDVLGEMRAMAGDMVDGVNISSS